MVVGLLIFGDMWRDGCPRSPRWDSEDEAWSEDDSVDESLSSNGSPEGNVGNGALHVIGLCGPGDKVSLFLRDWELARVAVCCHMALEMLLPGNERGLGSWVAAAKGPFVTAGKAFLSPSTGCDKNGEGCGERMKEKERERRAPLSFVGWLVCLWSEGFPSRLCATVRCSWF